MCCTNFDILIYYHCLLKASHSSVDDVWLSTATFFLRSFKLFNYIKTNAGPFKDTNVHLFKKLLRRCVRLSRSKILSKPNIHIEFVNHLLYIFCIHDYLRCQFSSAPTPLYAIIPQTWIWPGIWLWVVNYNQKSVYVFDV